MSNVENELFKALLSILLLNLLAKKGKFYFVGHTFSTMGCTIGIQKFIKYLRVNVIVVFDRFIFCNVTTLFYILNLNLLQEEAIFCAIFLNSWLLPNNFCFLAICLYVNFCDNFTFYNNLDSFIVFPDPENIGVGAFVMRISSVVLEL